ncbi:MAG: DUF3467 domain-containing protein [Nanoarchaeota archaeon]
MSEEKKFNVSVNDGMDFFANETSINFSPTHFILDFKSITPRVDMRSKETPVLSVKHNVVLMDPYNVKRMHKMLGDVIKNYEKKYVKIKKPEALTKAEKDSQKTDKSTKKATVPNYLG